MKPAYDLDCNIAKTLNLVGDKWTILVLHRISTGRRTFKEIRDNLDLIPTNILSDRLKKLESEDLIASKLYNHHPPRYEYYVTAKGQDFNKVFNSMILWASDNLEGCKKTLGHSKCGHRVDVRYYCEECGEFLEEASVSAVEK